MVSAEDRRDGEGAGSDEARFAQLFEDIEAVHAGQELHERAGEFSDLVTGEVADHRLAHRLAGAMGEEVVLVSAGTALQGVISRAAAAWVRLDDAAGGMSVLAVLSHLEEVRLGGRRHTAPPESLSFRSPLRRWGEARADVAVGLASTAGRGRTLVGRVGPVGEDYAEFEPVPEGRGVSVRRETQRVILPLARIAWVRAARGARGTGSRL